MKVEKARCAALEKELGDFKSSCTCSQESSVEVTSVGTNRNFEPQEDLNGLECSAVDMVRPSSLYYELLCTCSIFYFLENKIK